MGAMVTILYKSDSITESDARDLAENVQKNILLTLNTKDVFVYNFEVKDTVAADPIEVFVQINKLKVPEPNLFLEDLSNHLSRWKNQTNFSHTINLNVVPVEWHSKFAI